jgi:hypothetical protein
MVITLKEMPVEKAKAMRTTSTFISGYHVKAISTKPPA